MIHLAAAKEPYMRHLILPSLFLLSACAHEGPVRIETVTVTKEVQRPCPGTKPKRPEPLARPLPSDLEQLAAVLAAKLGEYALPGQYADQAEAIMDRCLGE
jgi:hypothetical protein